MTELYYLMEDKGWPTRAKNTVGWAAGPPSMSVPYPAGSLRHRKTFPATTPIITAATCCYVYMPPTYCRPRPMAPRGLQNAMKVNAVLYIAWRRHPDAARLRRLS